MSLRRVLLSVGLAFCAVACGGQASRMAAVPVVIELGEYLRVAATEGRVEPLSPAGANSPAGFRMAPGSRLTLHFALPDDPILIGEWHANASAVDEVHGRVRVVVATDGDAQIIEAASTHSADDDPGDFRRDLSSVSGEMVRLQVDCEEVGAGSEPCAWRSMRIEGSREQPLQSAVARERYNVFVILLDSLRQDHLEPYGATDVKTPNLLRFAESGVTFENAHSNASWTRPSVAAMLTSLPPPAHGVLTMEDGLAPNVAYLPEILQRSGYRTTAVLNNPNSAGSYGFARGFDRLFDFWSLDKEALGFPSDPEAQAKFVWSRFIKSTVRSSEPFFVFLHELDPHSPYEPPEPYRSEYGVDYQGEFSSSMLDLRSMQDFPDRVTPEDVRYLNARYKGEVAFMDRYVGWILDRITSLPLERPTLIVFASDHGEEFWEHDSVGHGATVHEELLRVPLMMQLAGVLPAGRRVRTDVTLSDLAPTILDLLGIEIPDSMQGESLLPFVAGSDDRAAARPVIARGNDSLAEESISLGRWKLIRNLGQHASATALYDLESDPGETRDRTAEHPIVAATLAQRLRWIFDGDDSASATSKPPTMPNKPGPELLKRLQELGYIE